MITASALAVVAVALLSAPALALDSSPPTFGNATAVNETAFEFVVEDDGAVNASTVGVGDFSFDRGTIQAITFAQRNNDTVVTVRLERPIPQNNVTVSIADGRSIEDEAGNTMTEGSMTVTGMDSYDPYLKEYSLERLSESTVRIEFYTDEPIENTSVVVSGPEREVLGPEDFTETDTRPSYEFRYRANYSFGPEGEYEVTLEWIEDVNENRAAYYADRNVVHDETGPQARIAGPASATMGQSVTFDATESTDNSGVARYEWAVDGNVTGTNETLTYAFNESGQYEVELTVADGRNNTDTTVTTLEVLDVSTTRGVVLTPRNGSGVDVAIGPNRSTGRVLLEGTSGLGSNASVRLDSMTLSVPTSESANLSTAVLAHTAAAFDVPEATGYGTISIDHEGTDVSDVTFRFTLNRSVLSESDVTPDGVSLYRESGGDWSRLPTIRVGGNDTHLEYRATSPGLSRFVVAGSNATGANDAADDEASTGNDSGSGEDTSQLTESSGARPTFAVVDAELLTRNVSADDPVVVQATVANDGNATGTYLAALVVDGSVVGTSEVTVPEGEQREVTVAVPLESGGAASLNGTRLGTVSVGGGAVSTDGGGGGGVSIPNPLALWPGGLFGRALGAIFWLVVVVYAILKSLAIYLGY